MSGLEGIAPYWWWFAIGALLMAAETIAPGAFLLWFGIAAVATGVLDLLVGPSLAVQLIVFSTLGVTTAVAWRQWSGNREIEVADAPNRYGEGVIGETLTLVTAIEHGHGRARHRDTSVRVDGPDLPAGSRVRVIGVDGGTLQVESAGD